MPNKKLASITCYAYAKINLGLRILDKRPDGYHNIETIMIPIDFCDTIEISTIDNGIHFSSDKPPKGKENICFKAADIFLSQLPKCTSGLKIKLTKKIWTGAGLGGGSSDAAQVLLGCNKLLGYPLSQSHLLNMAQTLGSDVPFFFDRNPAFVTGRGEIVERLPKLKNPVFIILVYPKIKISSKWAYEKVSSCGGKKLCSLAIIKLIKENFLQNNIEKVSKILCNDFEELVLTKYPVIKKLKKQLQDFGVTEHAITGSGSCLYGFLHDNQETKKYEQAFKNCEIKIVKTI